VDFQKIGILREGAYHRFWTRLKGAWIEIHKEELMVDWELAVNGDEPFRIAPLQ
jgi:hypothetical protein